MSYFFYHLLRSQFSFDFVTGRTTQALKTGYCVEPLKVLDVVWGCQVVETKIYFRFRLSTRPLSCRGKISAAHFPVDV
jgi:hypothetical protein